MSLNRMLPFLLLNIVVSTVVVLIVLTVWERRGAIETDAEPTAVVIQEAPTTVEVDAPAEAVASAPGSVSADVESPPENVAPAPTATREEVYHIVVAGELLGTISSQYDVSVEDIVAANGLDNPDQIFVGQNLLIPIYGLETPVPESSGAGSPNVTPSPVPTVEVVAGEGDLAISNVLGVGDLLTERVEISNSGAQPVDLEGWTLADESGLLYTFRSSILYGGGAALYVYSSDAPDTANQLFWRQGSSIWSSGETAVLRDSDGNVRSTFVVP